MVDHSRLGSNVDENQRIGRSSIFTQAEVVTYWRDWKTIHTYEKPLLEFSHKKPCFDQTDGRESEVDLHHTCLSTKAGNNHRFLCVPMIEFTSRMCWSRRSLHKHDGAISKPYTETKHRVMLMRT